MNNKLREFNTDEGIGFERAKKNKINLSNIWQSRPQSIDEKSYQGGENGDKHPMAWYHNFDGGRVFYTELGHTNESFSEPLYLKHILGGIQYAMGADIRVCTPDSQLSILEAKWGLVPDMGGAALVRELLPVDVAKELTMTGRVLSGLQAKELGLVTHVVENPEEKVQALVEEMLTRSPDSVAASKFMLQRIFGIDEAAHLTQERRWQRRVLGFKNQRISVVKNSKQPTMPFAKRQIR